MPPIEVIKGPRNRAGKEIPMDSSEEFQDAPALKSPPIATGAKHGAKDTPPRDREVDKLATEMAKKRMLPQPPGKKIAFDEMQAYFKLLTPEMWHHIVIYIYRGYPRIIRKLKNPDTPNYIDCLSQPFDLDYMIEHHGGGKYTLMACDLEAKPRTTNNKLFDCELEINSSQYPPKLNYEELDINHKGNMAYVALIQHRGILDNKGAVMAAAAPANTNPLGSPDSLKALLDFVQGMSTANQDALRERLATPQDQSLSKSLGDIIIAKMTQDDPKAQLAAMLTSIKEVLAMNKAPDDTGRLVDLVTALKTLMPSGNGTEAAFAKVVEMQASHNATVLALFEKLAERRAEPPPNPQIEQLEQVFSFAERLANIRGGGGGRSGWDIGLDYAKELGGPILNLISTWRTGGARPMPPVAGGAATGAAFDPYANPAAMRALANTAQQQAPAAAGTGPQTPPPQNELGMLVQTYGGLIVNHLNMGTPGHIVADYITGLYGNGIHVQICAQGEPALVQTLMSVPEIGVFGEPRLQKFVHEFVCFQEFLDQDEEDEEPEPAPPPIVVDGATKKPKARGAAR
jgi:hypothetical protein